MDARSEGSFLQERRDGQRRTSRPDRNPNAYARLRASTYVQQIEKTRKAYDAHGGLKVLVKYEDLRADTLGTMKRIYSTLEMPVEEAELARSVEKHSWENIPEEEKGAGKFHRKAKPGGWREDLTARQVEIVEDITAPLLNEFYPHTATTRDAL
jgi:Sulfotransferase domain